MSLISFVFLTKFFQEKKQTPEFLREVQKLWKFYYGFFWGRQAKRRVKTELSSNLWEKKTGWIQSLLMSFKLAYILAIKENRNGENCSHACCV